MKSLQEFGVQELKTNELTLVNGGDIGIDFVDQIYALINRVASYILE